MPTYTKVPRSYKTEPPQDPTVGSMGVLGGWAFSYERGTPVVKGANNGGWTCIHSHFLLGHGFLHHRDLGHVPGLSVEVRV